MSYTSLVVDWIATLYLLIEQKEREIRVLYSEGFKLKKVAAKTVKEFEDAKELHVQNKISQNDLLQKHLELVEAERTLNRFIYNELPRKGKEIQLQIDSLINNLNRLTKLKLKLDDKLKSQKSKNQKQKEVPK